MVIFTWLVLTFSCATGHPNNLRADLAFPGIDGQRHQPLAGHNFQPTVLVFIASDCPICNSYAPQINQLVKAYGQTTNFYFVYVEPDLSTTKARQHARDYGFVCRALLDRNHELVRMVGATITPEAAIISSDGRLVYRGRIDDRYVDFGKKRLEPSQHDLRDAIEAILHGRLILHPRTKAVGCFISDPGST